jgi:hypothetical protein
MSDDKQPYQMQLLIASIVDIAKAMGIVAKNLNPAGVTYTQAILLADSISMMSPEIESTPTASLLGEPQVYYTLQCASLEDDNWMDMADPVSSLWMLKRNAPENLNPNLKFRIMPWERLKPIPLTPLEVSKMADKGEVAA